LKDAIVFAKKPGRSDQTTQVKEKDKSHDQDKEKKGHEKGNTKNPRKTFTENELPLSDLNGGDDDDDDDDDDEDEILDDGELVDENDTK